MNDFPGFINQVLCAHIYFPSLNIVFVRLLLDSRDCAIHSYLIVFTVKLNF